MTATIRSPNFDERRAPCDLLLIHYTGRPSLEESLAWLTDPAKKVSAHYLISEAGEVFQLVDEAKRAWHAGASYWAGARDINSCAIGIELQNPGHEFGYEEFPEAQIAALITIAGDILSRHGIPAGRVLGHSDVAPARKADPGEKFPWQRLAGAGIGRWPDRIKTPAWPEDRIRAAFTRFGYDPDAPLGDVVRAFQRHWVPENITGTADGETLARLAALL